jgi:hypothetical protein
MAWGQRTSSGVRARHRVALEVEVVEDPDAAEPEDWDLEHLRQAVVAGVARPLRTIQGHVIDSEHDRLSRTLDAVAEDLDEAVQLHWLASAKEWPSISRTLHPRPSLEALVELERLATAVREVAGRLHCEGL